MNRMAISSGLSMPPGYCERVVEGASTLLAETGLLLRSERARSFFAEHVDGTTVRRDRVCFSRESVHGFLEMLGKPAGTAGTDDAPKSLGHGESWCCLNIYDSKSDCIRPGDEKDLARIVRFLDAYEVPGIVPPVALTHLPPNLRDLEATRICLENSPVYGGPTQIPGSEDVELYREMAAVTRRPMPVLAMLILNPMGFDDAALEFVLDYRDAADLDVETVGGLPSIGNTAPIVYPAAHMQILAEDIGASIFTCAATGRLTAPYLRGDPFDMKYANYVVGGADYVLLDMASRKIHEFLAGSPREWGYLLSMSKKPDVQATYERTAGCWLQALNGATWFKGSGQLSSDEVYSPEQVVIDRAIVKGVERLIHGVADEYSVEESVAMVIRGAEAGSFLEQDQTLERFREFSSENGVFKATNLGQWAQMGSRECVAEAAREVTELSGGNTFARSDTEIKALRKLCNYKRMKSL